MGNMNNNPLPTKSVAKRSVFLGSLSLRAKLILGNMLVLALAIVGTGYYVYSRTNQANTYLTGQLEKMYFNKLKMD